MTKTIIVGYTDAAAQSAPEIICGPETPAADQARIMEDAKLRHKFPDEMARIEIYALGDPFNTAIFINAQAALAAQNIDGVRKKQERDERARTQAQRKAEDAIITARKAVTAAATKRNQALAAVAAVKGKLQNAAGKDQAPLQEKISKLQPLADQAIAEFKITLAAHDVIKNPKSTAEDFTTALIVIKDPAAEVKYQADLQAQAEKAAADKAAEEKAAADKKAAEDKAAADKLKLELQQKAEAGGQTSEDGAQQPEGAS